MEWSSKAKKFNKKKNVDNTRRVLWSQYLWFPIENFTLYNIYAVREE